jgi:hypothetical protein
MEICVSPPLALVLTPLKSLHSSRGHAPHDPRIGDLADPVPDGHDEGVRLRALAQNRSCAALISVIEKGAFSPIVM